MQNRSTYLRKKEKIKAKIQKCYIKIMLEMREKRISFKKIEEVSFEVFSKVVGDKKVPILTHSAVYRIMKVQREVMLDTFSALVFSLIQCGINKKLIRQLVTLNKAYYGWDIIERKMGYKNA
ncbi:hypothetical protein [Clostridium hydrogenum]|uniref:hypothetical protein n=1 Tax=Clostridium hydrogenum TaxID=2855764 RepID=UPI001F2EE81F|nr:hypothetical protein [Clostridium hydrogenum]